MPLSRFAAQGPEFDPIRFFTGHTRSWGVMEDRGGAPVGRVMTDCLGETDADGTLRMVQRLTLEDGTVQTRVWRMRRVAPHRFEATANDMLGTAQGEASGRAFHWRWVLATDPGHPLKDVTMRQWMYLMDDGAMVNRTTISKLGVILEEVTEQFEHAP
ncbi:MAG: DUF3833 family protein [Acidisphaera sp.]|nr:DUF3833 family protein [Acidisphaera sp.]